jgi:hypothetical protein
MSTPWPDDVLDCAKRLAKSLGYEDSQIRVVEGRVMIYRAEDESYHGRDGIYWYWHPLDPRDPTVWSALIGEGKVMLLRYYSWDDQYSAQTSLLTSKADYHWYKHPGIAVCEAYNELKGNGRGKAKPPQKFSTEEICGFFEVPIEILR